MAKSLPTAPPSSHQHYLPSKYFLSAKLIIRIVIIILLVLISLYAIFSYYMASPYRNAIKKQQTTNNPPIPYPTLDTEYWRIYSNKTIGVEFQIPKVWGEPTINQLSTRYEIAFNLGFFTISLGVYYDQNLGRELTFDEYVQSVSTGTPKPTNYFVGTLSGKKITYSSNKYLKEYLLIFPVKSHQILAVNYHTDNRSSSAASDEENTVYQILSTFKFLDQPIPTSNIQSLCESSGGKWLADYNECENVDEQNCTQLLKGTFDSCAVSCRHEPGYPLIYCTRNCVSVCTVK